MTAGLRIAARLDGFGGVWLAGWAAIYDAPVSPPVARREVSRLAYEAQISIDHEPRRAERLLREAIEIAVDGFLLDRIDGIDLYVKAHQLGAFVEERFTCRFRPTDDGMRLENPCGVLALHSRIGLSPGGKTWGRCSICGAGDFECDHVPGHVYGGQRCGRIIYRWDGDEISATARPRDPRCFRTWSQLPLRTKPGTVRARCQHCLTCLGRAAVARDDVDLSSWSDDPAELVAATDAVSRSAAENPIVRGDRQ
jgi:hypothetical protein